MHFKNKPRKLLFFINNILILYINILLIGCAIFKSDNSLEIKLYNPDLVIYSLPKEAAEDSFQITKENLISIFGSLEKEKGLKAIFQETYILSSDQVRELSFELFNLYKKEENNYKYLIISKRDDPISPATRLYRSIFLVSINSKNLQIDLIESDRNLIFGSQYQLNDWAPPQIPKTFCRFKKEISPDENFIYKFDFLKDSECSKNELTINYNKMIIDFSKKRKLQKNEKLNTTARLKELEKLKKEGLISEEEYKIKRKEILNDL